MLPRHGFSLVATALVVTLLAPPLQAGPPWPLPARAGMGLLARSFNTFTTNRVSCGFSSRGEFCRDSTLVSTGGFWPRGSADGYVFSSGLQVAGIIQGSPSAGNPWGGDTTGGFFFDPKGTTRHGVEVTPIYDGRNPVDVANWPDVSLVPEGDTVASLYAPALRGRVNASQGDLHFIAWEGDPLLAAGRPHPLGILADFRVMGWNYPAGNDDVMYLLITLYNISSTNPADYARHRPAMRALLLQKAADFQAANNARFSITLPTGGYTIGPMYAGIGADFDVGSAGNNLASANLPFALGFTYQANFFTTPGWSYDSGTFGAPFFPGSGFVGVKFLNSASGPPAIQLFTAHTGGSTGITDAGTVGQLFQYLSAAPSLVSGCNVPGVAAQTHICFLWHNSGVDVRQTQSSTAITLAPGQSTSFALAYLFAAPVALPGFTPVPSTVVDPGNPTWTAHPDSMLLHPGATGQPGVNRLDSLTGFRGYRGQTAHNGDGSEYRPGIADFTTVPRSLLGKAQLAQAFFDGHFQTAQPPAQPDFFLIPGDRQVTLLWKPSATEQAGDSYADVASQPSVPGGAGGMTPNLLYDPSYRRFDVEGYRIYRGRTEAPSAMRLIAQFDYRGTTFSDYGGVVAFTASGDCAPELGVVTACPGLTAITPGVPSSVHLDYPITGTLVQVRYGDRTLLATGRTITVRADTAVTGGASGLPPLADTDVPFVFVDRAGGCAGCGVYNNIRYYYAVTAFDVNSVLSGPSSLESSRAVKSVLVGALAPNYANSGGVTVSGPYGRGVLLTDNLIPAIDPATGKFSKKEPPSNAATVTLGTFVSQVLKAGTTSVQLDSVTFVSIADGGSNVTMQWYSANGTIFSLPVTINTANYTESGSSTSAFPALVSDGGLAGVYGGSGGFATPGTITVRYPPGYTTGTKGRGCVNGNAGVPFATSGTRQCTYNGPRWFIGDNETMSNPNSDNTDLFTPQGTAQPVTFSNSGELAGVRKIFRPVEYFNTATTWRREAGALSGFISGADYRLYWGAAGHVDSVIDLTHNTVVPFKPDLQASWGILNNSAVPAVTAYDQRAVLTFTDIGCVAPFMTNSVIQGDIPCSGSPAALSQTAIPGPVAFCAATTYSCNRTQPAAAGQGFLLYLKGEVFLLELTAGLPAAGIAWTMRDYTGAIVGGNGNAGNFGPYAYRADSVRPFTAPGLSYQFNSTITNQAQPATAAALAKVHTVPDPYYMVGNYDASITDKQIAFVNLPLNATVRIYTSSGRLARVLRNTSTSFGSTVGWDLKTGEGKWVASGVYFYTVEADGVAATFRLTIVNFTGTPH